MRTRALATAVLLSLVGPVAGASEEAAPGAAECDVEVEAGPVFGTASTLSRSLAASFMPAVAANGRRVLIAWQETDRQANSISYAIAESGCVGPIRRVVDPLPNPRRPAVAATATGWVLAYEARRTPNPLIRSIRLDANGDIERGPETVSSPGAVASRVRVAASGNDVVYAWTDALGHYLARTGSREELPPTPVGSHLEAAGLVNFPRVAVDRDGTIYLAYRDGGPERTDFEIQLVARRVGEPFSAPINVSKSKGLMSDDVALAIEADGRVSVVWVEQDSERPEVFEVVHATVDRELTVSPPQRFGALGMASFKPTVIAGPLVVWQAGTTRVGQLFIADGEGRPVPIMTGMIGGMASLADDAAGALHLAFVDSQDPPRLRYAQRLPRR